jgi:hypothetical protein
MSSTYQKMIKLFRTKKALNLVNLPVDTYNASEDLVSKPVGHQTVTDMDKFFAKTININKVYTNFYKSLTASETQALNDYVQDTSNFYKNPNSIQILMNLFTKVPPIPSTIYVYRCFLRNVSINDIDRQPNLNTILATSLTQRTARIMCYSQNPTCYKNRDNDENLEICIIIPKGARILPIASLIGGGDYVEYQILLPPTGTLVSTSECHPVNKAPIFVYFEDSNRANQFKESRQQVTPQPVTQQPVTQQIAPQPAARTWLQRMVTQAEDPPDSEDMMQAVSDAYGGNKTSKKTRRSNKLRRSKKLKRSKKGTNNFNRKKNKTRNRK